MDCANALNSFFPTSFYLDIVRNGTRSLDQSIFHMRFTTDSDQVKLTTIIQADANAPDTETITIFVRALTDAPMPRDTNVTLYEATFRQSLALAG